MNKKIYDNILLVKKNGKFIKLSFNEITKNNDETYGIQNNCLSYNSIIIFNNI